MTSRISQYFSNKVDRSKRRQSSNSSDCSSPTESENKERTVLFKRKRVEEGTDMEEVNNRLDCIVEK